MKNLIVNPIGKIVISNHTAKIEIDKKYIPALKELENYSHLNVFWWFDECDCEKSRNILEVEAPYKNSPQIMGTFATRSPERPNPIALSIVEIIQIDHVNGIIELSHIDANENSPVIDLKPYTPSLDRVSNPCVPSWCSHWPKNMEDSAFFDWENEFNF